MTTSWQADVTILPLMNHSLLSLRMMDAAYPGAFFFLMSVHSHYRTPPSTLPRQLAFSDPTGTQNLHLKLDPSMPLRHFRRSLRPNELPWRPALREPVVLRSLARIDQSLHRFIDPA